MLHALAFSTLLSSQETDAFTLGHPIHPVEHFRGATSASPSYHFQPVRVKPPRSRPLDTNPPDPLGSRRPVSGATLPTYSDIQSLSNPSDRSDLQ